MRNNLVKYLSTGLVLTGLVATPLFVFAQNSNSTNANVNSNSANASVTKGWAKWDNDDRQKPSFDKELTITAINGTTLTATDTSGTSYTVNTENTREPKINDDLKLPAMSVGDKIQVVGNLNGTTVSARMTRDITLMEKYGPVGGNVTAINGNTFTILNNRQNISYTVTVDGNTKFSGNTSHILNSISDLKIGYHVQILGTKDSTAKTITATEVKIPAMNQKGHHGHGKGRGMGMGRANSNANSNATTPYTSASSNS